MRNSNPICFASSAYLDKCCGKWAFCECLGDIIDIDSDNHHYLKMVCLWFLLATPFLFSLFPKDYHASVFPFFLSSWSMLAKERASWTWVWPRPASHSPPAAITMKWRLLMQGRSATLPWVWQEGWVPQKITTLHTPPRNREVRFFFAFDPLLNFSTLSNNRQISAASRTLFLPRVQGRLYFT